MHRNLEDDVENLLAGKELQPDEVEEIQVVQDREMSQEIKDFYEESVKMQNEEPI